MKKASCHPQPDCPRGGCCAPSLTEGKSENVIIWVVARDEQTVHLFLHRPGQPAEPFSIGCGCSAHAGRPENLAKYLDAALACGQYSGLVLMGAAEAQKRLRELLSETVQRRIVAEIDRDVTGMQPPELLKTVQECALF